MATTEICNEKILQMIASVLAFRETRELRIRADAISNIRKHYKEKASKKLFGIWTRKLDEKGIAEAIQALDCSYSDVFRSEYRTKEIKRLCDRLTELTKASTSGTIIISDEEITNLNGS